MITEVKSTICREGNLYAGYARTEHELMIHTGWIGGTHDLAKKIRLGAFNHAQSVMLSGPPIEVVPVCMLFGYSLSDTDPRSEKSYYHALGECLRNLKRNANIKYFSKLFWHSTSFGRCDDTSRDEILEVLSAKKIVCLQSFLSYLKTNQTILEDLP